MFQERAAYLMTAGAMPVDYPPADQLRGNLDQYNMYGRITDPLPLSGSGGIEQSLIVSVAPFPFWLDVAPVGFIPASPGDRPAPAPPAWLPQGDTKYWGGGKF